MNASIEADYQTLHSNANDVQDKIDHAITRLARDAGVPRSEIKQKFFMKRHVNISNSTTLKTSTNLRTKVECAGLCLSMEKCDVFQFFQFDSSTFACILYDKDGICNPHDGKSGELYVNRDEIIAPCPVPICNSFSDCPPGYLRCYYGYCSRYKKGPSVQNVAGICSTKYGTLQWAEQQCENDSTCKWLQDYGCDNKNWRFCTGKYDIENFKGSGGCSRMKIASGGDN